MADPLAPDILPKVLAKYASWAKVSAAVDSFLPPEIQGEARRDYIERLAPDDVNDPPKLYGALVTDLIEHGRLETFVLSLFTLDPDNSILREILQRQITIDNDAKVSESALQSIRNRREPFLNSQTFFEGMEAARFRVCAVWVDDGIEPPGIKGTGFLIAPDLVLTARHVVKGLLDSGAPVFVGGDLVAPDIAKPGSHTRLAFVFDYWTLTSKFDLKAPPPGITIVHPAEKWLEWSSQTHPKDGISHVFIGEPLVEKRLDCAVIRSDRRVGAAVAGNRGSKMRGWISLNGNMLQRGRDTAARDTAIAILQHPSGGPQVFDKGNYKAEDLSHTRIWYQTEASQGSSGSPCFDSSPALVAFHNAGYPTNYDGDTKSCNQGVRIDYVSAAMPRSLVEELQKGGMHESALWSLSDDPKMPEAVLGRAQFKDRVIELFGLHPERRVAIVEQAAEVADVGKSGRSFSIRILKTLARGHPGFVVEFGAKELRGMAPENFLAEIGRRIGVTGLDNPPAKPADERQLARWWATELPQWFGQKLEAKAKEAGTAAVDTSTFGTGSALGRESVLREVVWIVIDDIHLDPPEGGIKELIAGMMGITDPDPLVGPGLKSLRWLVIGHVPDFVRERSIQYVRDEVSQLHIGEQEWVDCLATAFLSMGREADFDAATARALYQYSVLKVSDVANKELRLKALAGALPTAINVMLSSRRGT